MFFGTAAREIGRAPQTTVAQAHPASVQVAFDFLLHPPDPPAESRSLFKQLGKSLAETESGRPSGSVRAQLPELVR
jgi:hypothetical protein